MLTKADEGGGGVDQMLTIADNGGGVRKIFNNGSLGVLKLWIQRRIDVNFTLNIGQSQITCKLDPNK